jgi:hypothetical protein
VPFTQKLLSFTFDMANGDRVTVSGLRASATVTTGGSADYGGKVRPTSRRSCQAWRNKPAITSKTAVFSSNNVR